MCTDCGCSDVKSVELEGTTIALESPDRSPRTLDIHQRLLSKNDRFSRQNRDRLQSLGLLTLNIMSSPGSGKTALIERTAEMLAREGKRVGAIVGDLATENDARRLRAAGAEAVQITTGTACHLEAEAIGRALDRLPLETLDVLAIENVGNLVCPAAYDLGETLRVVLLSVTEGEDKPLKYPTAFRAADVVVLTKVDIAEVVGFEREEVLGNIRRMAAQAEVVEVSARSGVGMDEWMDFLRSQKSHGRESNLFARSSMGESN